MTEFRDNWWKQPLREWENAPSEDVVIPGRPNESPEILDGENPATDTDFTKEAGKIRRRLSDGPPPRNPNGDGGDGGDLGGVENGTGGIDACAYYLSFRYGHRWGIYIGLDCWFKYARYLFDNGVPADAAIDEAFDRECLQHFAVSDRNTLLKFLEQRLPAAGNGAAETRNWLAAHGAASASARGKFDVIHYSAMPEIYVGCGFASWHPV